jgi:DNA-binding transcriptional LysR family regulator
MLSNTNALIEFLPDVLSRFLASHPGVTVDLQERLSDEIVGLVAAGAAEIGVVAFSQVLGEAFVGLDRTTALQRFLAGRAARKGRRLRLRVQLRSFDGVCRMVEAGVGVGIVPQTTANRAARYDGDRDRSIARCVGAQGFAHLPARARLSLDPRASNGRENGGRRVGIARRDLGNPASETWIAGEKAFG